VPTVPADEFADRGKMVQGGGYIPYLSMTAGEMRLAMAAQRAKVLAQWYGNDAPQYKQAYAMLENALHNGVHGGQRWVGALPDALQPVAQFIKSTSRDTAPASTSGIYGRSSLIHGIGQEIVPVKERYQKCVQEQIKKGNATAGWTTCLRQMKIEQIFNDAIVNTGHHVLYHKISQNKPMPDRVYTKLLLHLGGVQGMAVAGDIRKSLMGEWVETGIIERNAQGAAGPIGSLKSSFLLSPDPAATAKKLETAAKKFDNFLPGGVKGIGNPAAVVAIIGAIAGAIVAVATLINALRQQQAVIAAQSFGTEAYSARQSDWDGAFGSHGIDPVLLIGAAAAIWWLMEEN